MFNNNQFLAAIHAFQAKGIESFFVGGCVRDTLLDKNSQPDDIDICLVGAKNIGDVQTILDKFSDSVTPEPKGNAFPVWIADFNGSKIDFALARKESKSGQSRKDFEVLTQGISIIEDLKRRDLTINAIAQNVLSGEIVDPFGGINDLESGIGREVSDAFAEDPLRVLRAARFISRFGLSPAQSLIDLCRELKPLDISAERVEIELTKMLKQAKVPSQFFRFLREVNWLGFHFQEVEALIGLQQDPEWHPEGDVFEHTMHCMDASNDPFIRLVMLCHDLGKVTTTIFEDGRWKAPGHAKAGVKLARNMLTRIKMFKDLDKVLMLVEQHMFHTQNEFTRRAVARMIRRLDSVGLEFGHLVEVCRCDVSGRPPLKGFTPDIGQSIATSLLEQKQIERIITGKDLIAAGVKQGPELGQLLAIALDAQDRGELTPENKNDFLKELLG
jgi:tRNA nucleotidyltransferase (CCA-adding enzyme)